MSVGLPKVCLVLALLILAYCGKYFCTSCLYIVQVLWKEDQSISDTEASFMFVGGYVASMIGKAVSGPLSDMYGGKIVMLVSATGFIASITAFAYVPYICHNWFGMAESANLYWVFFGTWFSNGFFGLGLSWVAIMAVASNWIPAAYNGRLMAVLGTAPEVGDAWARAYLAPTVEQTGSWSETLLAAARISIVLVLPMLLCVQDKPPPEEQEEKRLKRKSSMIQKLPFFQRLKMLFVESPLISMLISMCAFLYGIRTMFLLYAVSYLSHAYCLHDAAVVKADYSKASINHCLSDPGSVAVVADASVWYTLLGCVGVLISGYGKDVLPNRHRGFVLVGNVTVLVTCMIFMYLIDVKDMSFLLATILVAGVGFSVFGAYKTATGAFAVDIGGKELKATCSAMMGFSSNGAAAIMLIVKGHVADDWHMMFRILLGLAAWAFICGAVIWAWDLNRFKKIMREQELEFSPRAPSPTDTDLGEMSPGGAFARSGNKYGT
eukprot:Hpha_TRINITY_DN16435_c1_g10::TRINITY_DN16435_c1_g10_i1::g.162515::m.162515